MSALGELVRKDVRLFLSDRSAAIISIAVPVGIAAFLSLVLSGSGGSGVELKPIGIVVADADQSRTSKAILDKLQNEPHLKVVLETPERARLLAKEGKTPLAIVIPVGFGAAAVKSISEGGSKPEIENLTDPAQNTTVMAAQGFVTKGIVSAVVADAFPDNPGVTGDDNMPFSVKTTPQTSKDTDDTAATRAHTFAGMAVQGVLFYAINLAMHLLRDRRLGIWKRLKSAPVPFASIALAKVLSGTLVGLFTLGCVFAFGMGFMGVRVTGSPLGFGVQCVATAVMASTFGLLVSSLGKTEEQSRGLSVFVVLMLSMLGGAWFPSFLMPQWMQSATLLVPTRWAIDGLDASLWRGADFAGVLPSIAGTLAFSVVFFFFATARLRATEASA